MPRLSAGDERRYKRGERGERARGGSGRRRGRRGSGRSGRGRGRGPARSAQARHTHVAPPSACALQVCIVLQEKLYIFI